VDTLYSNDYKGTLAEAMADPSSLANASWQQTNVEVIGPIPEGIEKLASPGHWRVVAATQAICREDAITKFVEAIGKTGCKAKAKYGIIDVSMVTTSMRV
jgi:hypothetical protein